MSWPGCLTRSLPLPKFRRNFYSTMKAGPDRLTWVGTTRYLGVGDSGRDPLHDCQVFLLRRNMKWRMAENLGLRPLLWVGWGATTEVCQLRGVPGPPAPPGHPREPLSEGDQQQCHSYRGEQHRPVLRGVPFATAFQACGVCRSACHALHVVTLPQSPSEVGHTQTPVQ